MAHPIFSDRTHAGRLLASEVVGRHLTPPVLVLGLPRGGVPVAYEVARALNAPMDVMLVRKIGMPGQPELAIGAIASGSIVVHDAGRAEGAVANDRFQRLVEVQRRELERRERLYRGDRGPLNLAGRTALLVDDGLATGATMLAAIRAARKAAAAVVVVAAPIASREAVALIDGEADEVVILTTPPTLWAIGDWYEDFAQVEDDEVCRLLRICGPVVAITYSRAPS